MTETTPPGKKKPVLTSYVDSDTGEQHTAQVIPANEYEKPKSPLDYPIDGTTLQKPEEKKSGPSLS